MLLHTKVSRDDLHIKTFLFFTNIINSLFYILRLSVLDTVDDHVLFSLPLFIYL